MKRLTKKKLLMQSNLQKIMYDINNNRFVFDDDENLNVIQILTFNKFIARQFICDDKFQFQLIKFFFLIMRVNSFTEINDKNFNKIFFSTIKKNFKEVIKFISKSKNDAQFNAHESLFHKQKNKIRFDVKI